MNTRYRKRVTSRRKVGRSRTTTANSRVVKQEEGVVVPRVFGATPKILTVYMKMFEIQNSGNIATTAGFDELWKANSVNAPQMNGGTSIRPYSYDLMIQSFNRYRVVRCRSTLKMCQNSAAIPLFFGCGFINGTIPTAVTNLQSFNNFVMAPRIKNAIVSSTEPKTIVCDINNWQLANSTARKYVTDDLYQSVYNANPTEVQNFYLAGYNASTGNATFEWSITNEYKVIWFDEFVQGGSTFFKYQSLLRKHPELDKFVTALVDAEEKGYTLDLETLLPVDF